MASWDVYLVEELGSAARRLRRRLYEDNKNKVQQGEQAPIEVTRAQAQVASSRQALISAEGLVQQQELIVKALRDRPDLAQAGIQVENFQISLKGSLNALRPELDVVGTMQNGGLSGDINAPGAALTPGAALYPGGDGTALGQIFRNNFPTYSVGLQLTLPLRNRIAQADAVRDQLQVRQTHLRRQQFEIRFVWKSPTPM